MSTSAEGVHLKLAWSRHQANQLRGALSDYFGTNPFAEFAEDEAVTGDLVVRLSHRPPPPELGLILGDSIHNLRSAFDHLAWQLVIAGGGTPNQETAFPFTKRLTLLTSEVRRRLNGATTLAMTRVEALQPCGDGDKQLWKVHTLDIEDKHRLLITVGAAHRSVNLAFSPPMLPGASEPPPSLTAAFFVADRQFPLVDGKEVGRIMKAARGADEPKLANNYEVAFADGEALFPTLPDLIDHCERTIQPLLELL